MKEGNYKKGKYIPEVPAYSHYRINLPSQITSTQRIESSTEMRQLSSALSWTYSANIKRTFCHQSGKGHPGQQVRIVCVYCPRTGC